MLSEITLDSPELWFNTLKSVVGVLTLYSYVDDLMLNKLDWIRFCEDDKMKAHSQQLYFFTCFPHVSLMPGLVYYGTGTNTEKVRWQTPPVIRATAELGHGTKTFCICVLLYLLYPHWMQVGENFVRQSSTKHCAKQNQSAAGKRYQTLNLSNNLTQICGENFSSSTCAFIYISFPNEACVLSLSINLFIETLAKWRYRNGHYNIFWWL